MKTLLRVLPLTVLAAFVITGALSAQTGVAVCGSNTYIIDGGGRLTYTLPADMANNALTTTGYHKGKSQGFDVAGGAVAIPSGEGEIQARGSIILTAANGDSLELRQLQVENFGDASFVTAVVIYTPNGGARQHNGRTVVFQIVRAGSARFDDQNACTIGATLVGADQEFTIATDTAFASNYVEFTDAPGAKKASDNYGSLSFTYGGDQEEAPTK